MKINRQTKNCRVDQITDTSTIPEVGLTKNETTLRNLP